MQRVAHRDQSGVTDCLDTYGNFIWALANKYTGSMEESEAAAREIFTDIWRYSQRRDKTPSAEEMLEARIALRRLIKSLR